MFQGGTDGEEGSKGRQEKGREEALTPHRSGGSQRRLCTPDFFDRESPPRITRNTTIAGVNAVTRSDERRMDAPPTCRRQWRCDTEIALANESHTKGGIKRNGEEGC